MKKVDSLNEIKEILNSFCEKHLNDELLGYAFKLCGSLGRKKKINLSRGRKEIWAASIIYAIVRLNFLFARKTQITSLLILYVIILTHANQL